ncbi:branched-chain amino acid ABC transporter permease [Dankookia sp. P2]|uniref:branched-chain amino acid ABC transporter permease n=1 Tax=Dankookia sp. P2 TaxID=3423955 RepID=UPI003D66BB6F
MLESFHLFQLTMAVIMALAVLGLNIVSGYNGQISLGHGAFFAVGAYITAILMSHWDWSFWATLPFSAAICAAIGFAIGFPALRLAGHYLALTTFSLAVAVPQILKHKSIEDWTGGVQGLFLVKPDAPAGIGLSPDQWMYVVTVIVAGACFLLVSNLIRSRIGRALMATRDHPTAAEAMGMDIASLKTKAFAVSAMITGIAGSLSAVAIETRGARQLRLRRLHHALRRDGGGRRRLDPGVALWRIVRAVRAEHRGSHQQGSAGRDLRRHPHPLPLPAAGRLRRAGAARRRSAARPRLTFGVTA